MVILNRLYKLSAGIFFGCLVCLFMVGCGGKADSPKKEKQTQKKQAQAVVRQKIPAAESQPEADPSKKPVQPDKKEPVSPAMKETASAAPTAPDKATAPAGQPGKAVETSEEPHSPEKQAEIDAITEEAQHTVKVDAATKEVERIIAAKQQEAGSEEAPSGDGVSGEVLETTAEAPVIDFDKEASTEGDMTASGEDGDADDAFFNPFAPLFQNRNKGVSAAQLPSFREQREFLTPLEKIDIGQLTLKGIIQAQSGNRAIVVDASGEGYVITQGTFVGLNSGTVNKIESDRIVIIESIGTRQSQTVLKLQKPAGE